MNGPRQLPLPLPPLGPSFARDDFLAGPSNSAALALVDRWPDWPAPQMLLVGPEGSGKSHLAAIFAERADAASLRGGEIAQFDPDAAVNALVIDDADVGAAEDAFFHLLNFARARDVFVLMTAKAPPDLWGLTTPDLKSRLRLAPLVEIAPPEPALIEAVLIKLFSDRQMNVEPSLAAYVARRLDRSLGQARALVDALDVEAMAQGGKVTRTMAAALLRSEAETEG